LLQPHRVWQALRLQSQRPGGARQARKERGLLANGCRSGPRVQAQTLGTNVRVEQARTLGTKVRVERVVSVHAHRAQDAGQQAVSAVGAVLRLSPLQHAGSHRRWPRRLRVGFSTEHSGLGASTQCPGNQRRVGADPGGRVVVGSHDRLTDRREIARLCRSRAALQMAITHACVGVDRWRTSAPPSVWTRLGEPAQSA